MDSATTIKQEYFELIKKLNQSNKLKNQATAPYFYIDSSNLIHLKLFAAISDFQKILLCEKINALPWAPTNNTEFADLEEFLSALLNTTTIKGDLTTFIKSHVFKLE